MERIENAMVQDGHWDYALEEYFSRLEARAEALEERREALRLQEAFDAEIARMDKLDDELKRATRLIEGP